MSMEHLGEWDPMKDREMDSLTPTAMTRIKRDLMSLYTEPPPGIFVTGDDANLKYVYAIIVGPMGTPYEGGFFYFMLKCPNDYPLHPPRVKLFTTDSGKVRFNPNLYKNGKICISILGTWTGPAWSPAQQLSSLLITIQSLLTEKPYFNEPGIKSELVPGDANRYNEIIIYQTLRVAVCGMVENECHLTIPPRLQEIIKESFLTFYDQYIQTIDDKMHLNGCTFSDPFSHDRVTLDYKQLKSRIEALHKRILNEQQASH